MTIAAIRHQPIYPAQERTIEVVQSDITPKNWLYLIPTISVLALEIIYTANIPIGMAIGVGCFAFGVVALMITSLLNMLEEDGDSKYEKVLRDYPLLTTLAAPFVEEGFFRGFLQPLATRTIVFLIPAAAGAFLGTSLSIATTVSIVATAAFFGFIHIFNDHKNSHIQAITATIAGVAFGVTAAQFGLPAAIAAHIVNNTLAMVFMTLFKEETAATSQLGSPV